MSEGVEALLASVPKLVEQRDAAALVALSEHDDKQVRKSVRKALHVLKSRGIDIPKSAPKSWNPGATIKSLRGDLGAVATVDTRTGPAVLRFTLSEPDDEEGGRLFAGVISADDKVLDFAAYTQTDGQRLRTVRDWKRRGADRLVDAAWLKARIRWAREQTLAAGFTVPRALDQSLTLLGDAPTERPVSFLGARLEGVAAFDPAQLETAIAGLRIPSWPPLLDLEGMLEKAATLHGDKPQPTEESARMELLRSSAEGDPAVREGLAGPLANALDDAAIARWVAGDDANAQAGFSMAAQLRAADAPERFEWAAPLLGQQVASLLRSVGGEEAVRKAIAEQQANARAQAETAESEA